MKVVIVGGVAGGASAAARLRRLNEDAEIIIFERSGFISYANCGLPYYIGGVIEEKKELTLQTPKSFGTRFNVDVRVNHEVLKINREGKTLLVRNLETNEEFLEVYDKLILSPGAKAMLPDLEGLDNEKVFTLRTVEDTFKIDDYINSNNVNNIVVSGGGFIGLEVAENLIEKGKKITIVQLSDQLMDPVDYELASFIHPYVRQKGLNYFLETTIDKIEDNNNKLHLTLSNNKVLEADMLVMAIGVKPESILAKDAGLKLGIKDSIVVDEHMQTSDPDIYAVGDVVQIKNRVSGLDSLISLAGPANKQGRIAADNICGINSSFKGAQGSSVIKLFDMTVAATGLNEKMLKRLDIDYDKVFLSPASHASYYPDSTTMNIKVLFEKKTDRLLGAQIVGYDGVDKRIDVFATAIFAGISASDLKDLDLAYAPPYSSAKDPVNMAGFMIDNINNGVLKQFFYEDIDELVKRDGITLLDTRTVKEYSNGHVYGFVNIPVDELRSRIDEIDKNKPVYVMCQSGIRSYIATRILSNLGFDAYNYSGGYRLYASIHDDKLTAKTTLPCGMEIR